ncbi:MAG: 3'-5' exonuclease [Flavobacteriales bacterium]|nr:3'-5' exonuclease [Flavobacteriales bacterium]
MLASIHFEEILFIDIETVPQQPSFELLDDDFKMLWTDKTRFTREKQQLSVEQSYESAGIYAEFGKVICVGAGYFAQKKGERVFRCTSFSGHDEKKVLEGFASLLETHTNNPFKLLCAHNGKEFDFPYLSRRMLVNGIKLPMMLDTAGRKPWEVSHIDTLELWKFGDFKHYTSLKLLAKIFGVPTPKDDIDGSQVRQVYWEEKNLERIDIYCRKDVLTVAQIFLRYKGEPILEEKSVFSV